jgi:hypothetical protein
MTPKFNGQHIEVAVGYVIALSGDCKESNTKAK